MSDGNVGHGVTKKNSCCTCTADWMKRDTAEQQKKWWAIIPLVIINFVTILLGICFLGVSAYVTATFDAWKQYISWTGLVACVIASLFVLLLGILGCCGAINRNILMLTIYLFCLFILCFIVLAIATVVLVYGGTICGGNEGEDKTCVTNLASREVSNALLKVQTECCQVKNTTVLNGVDMCTAKTYQTLYTCMYPECDGNNEDYCVKAFTPCTLGMKTPADMKCERKFPPPMTTTPDAMCLGIKSLIFKDLPNLDGLSSGEAKNKLLEASIWHDAQEKICMDNSQVAFIKKISAYFETNMKNFGMGLVILAAFLILMMFFAFASCCANKSKLNTNNGNDLTHQAQA